MHFKENHCSAPGPQQGEKTNEEWNAHVKGLGGPPDFRLNMHAGYHRHRRIGSSPLGRQHSWRAPPRPARRPRIVRAPSDFRETKAAVSIRSIIADARGSWRRECIIQRCFMNTLVFSFRKQRLLRLLKAFGVYRYPAENAKSPSLAPTQNAT